MKHLYCSCNKKDCFGNENGECAILSEAIKVDCPFYKTHRNITKGKVYSKWTPARLVKRGKPKKGDEL